jgi:ubiquinone/menaquinone biosynthesis C-methylase UbiE
MIDHDTRHKQHELLKREFLRAKAYAREYIEESPQAHFFNTRIKRVSELLTGFHRGRVLDIGCGPAVVGNLFRGTRVEYYGVDLSEAMIDVCRESFGKDPQFAFSIQEIEMLGFADASFDVVLCLGVLEYVLDEPAAIREVVRVMKPGGIFIATMLNKASPFELYNHYCYGKVSSAIRRIGHFIKGLEHRKEETRATGPKRPLMTLLNEKSFHHLLTSLSLEIHDSLCYDFHIIPPPLDSLFSRVNAFLSDHLEFLCRSRFRFLGRGYMVKCEKRKEERPMGKLERL